MMLLWRQDDVASTDAGCVGGEVQKTRTGSKVLRPCVDALQPHVDRARGDRGDNRDGGDGGDITQLLFMYAVVVTGTSSTATRSHQSATSTSVVPGRHVQRRLDWHSKHRAQPGRRVP